MREYRIYYDNKNDSITIVNDENETEVTFDASQAEEWAKKNIDMTWVDYDYDGSEKTYVSNIRSMIQNDGFNVPKSDVPMWKRCQNDIKALMFAML